MAIGMKSGAGHKNRVILQPASLDNLTLGTSNIATVYSVTLLPSDGSIEFVRYPFQLNPELFLNGCFDKCFRLPPLLRRPAHHI